MFIWYNYCTLIVSFQIESTAFADSLFGNGEGPIVYSDVDCIGSETNLDGCSKRMYPESSCMAGVAAGVMCADGEPHAYRSVLWCC